MANLKKTEIGFQDKLSLNAGQKYCRMLPLEHSAILSTFIKLPVVSKTFVLSIFEWPFYAGYTVQCRYKAKKSVLYVANLLSSVCVFNRMH